MKKAIAAFAFILAAHGLVAQSGVGVEFNVVWPFVPGVGIYSLKATVPAWGTGDVRGEVTAGLLFRPPTFREEEGTFSEIGLNLGYRQFVWRNLHAEIALWPSIATLRGNVVDGEDYRQFALTMEGYAGYRFDIPVGPLALYLLPQAGLGATVLESNPWPKLEEDGPFFVGSLLVGALF